MYPVPALLAASLLTVRAGAPPLITRHPVPQHSVAGHSVRFLSGSSDIFATVQWERDSVPIPGATGPELILRHVLPQDEGEYRAVFQNARVVAGAPPVGESVTRPASLTVTIPLQDAGAQDLLWGDPALASVIRAVVALPDGGCLAAGGFPRGNLVRLGPDGTPDPAFSASADAGIRALVPHGSGGWVAGGDFTTWNGSSCPRLVRLHPDGTLDPGFHPPAIGGTVRCLATQAVSGEIRILAGLSTAPWLLQIRPDGSPDPAFSQAVAAAGLNSRVLALAVQPDGRILLGGSFFAAGSWPFFRIGRLLAGGTPDPDFPHGAADGTDFDVQALALQPDGRILTGGKFNRLHGQSRFFLARLLPDGRLDTAWDPAPNGAVNAIVPVPGGGALVAGEFTRVSGQTIRSLARLAGNGALDPSWLPPSLDGDVRCLALSDHAVLCGGEFSQPHTSFLRLRNTPSTGPAFRFPGPAARCLTTGTGIVLTAPSAAAPETLFAWSRNGSLQALTSVPELPLSVITPDHAGIWTSTTTSGEKTSLTLSIIPPVAGDRPVLRVLATDLPRTMLNEGVTTALFAVPPLNVEEVRVTVSLTHYDTNDLSLDLVSPDGRTVRLFDPASARRGRNFEHTTFAMAAPERVDQAAAPFTGTWRPVFDDPGMNFFAGPRPGGNWQLLITDTRMDSNAGSLREAVLEIHTPRPRLSASQWITPPPGLPAAIPGPGLLCLPHWAAPDNSALTWEFSTSLRNWQSLSPVRLRQFPDQRVLADLPIPAGPCGFVRVRQP